MKNKYWAVLTFASILIMVTAVAIAFNYYYNEIQRECINDPFVFEAQRLEKATGENISCSCIFLTHLDSPTIYFDSKNVTIKK